MSDVDTATDRKNFTQYCHSCRYWETFEEHPTEAGADEAAGCHRHAPAIGNPVDGFKNPAVWPQTFANEFCGDWEEYRAPHPVSVDSPA